MIKQIVRTPHFKRDYKALLKKHVDTKLFEAELVALVAQDDDLLRTRFKDYALKGEWAGYRELHISGDCLLIYRIVVSSCNLFSRERNRTTTCFKDSIMLDRIEV